MVAARPPNDRSKSPHIDQKEKYSIKSIFYKIVDIFFMGKNISKPFAKGVVILANFE